MLQKLTSNLELNKFFVFLSYGDGPRKIDIHFKTVLRYRKSIKNGYRCFVYSVREPKRMLLKYWRCSPYFEAFIIGSKTKIISRLSASRNQSIWK